MVNKRTCMRSRSSSGLSSQVPKNIYISLARRPLLMLALLSTEFYIALLKKRSDLILQVNNYVKFFLCCYPDRRALWRVLCPWLQIINKGMLLKNVLGALVFEFIVRALTGNTVQELVMNFRFKPLLQK